MPDTDPKPGESTEAPSHAAPTRPWLKDFLRPSKGQAIAAAVLFVTALMVTWTVRSQDPQPEFAQARQEDLVQLLDTVTSQNRALETELRELQSNRDELLSGADKAESAREDARRRLEQLQILAGTIPAHGPGIRIEISAEAGKITPELMLNAVDELRDAGAEVIEINDTLRIVVDTAFTVADDGALQADGQTLTLPLTLEIIGDPVTLEAGARFRGGLVSQVEGPRVGGTVQITQLDEVRIESVVEPRRNEFARPR